MRYENICLYKATNYNQLQTFDEEKIHPKIWVNLTHQKKVAPVVI